MKNLLTKANSYLPNEPVICLEQLHGSSIITNGDNEENKSIYYLIEGKAFVNMGKIPDAERSIKKGLTFLNISKTTYARLLMWLGYIAAQNHELAPAKKFLNESISIFKALDESKYLADALAFKGMALIKESNFTEALTILMDSLDLAVSCQRPLTETRVCSYISVIHYWLKDLDKAEKWLDRSYIISKKKGYTRLIIANRVNAANINILAHQPKAAIPKLEEAKELITNSGHDWNSLLATTLNNIGNAYTHENNLRPIKALEYHYDALEISERIYNKSSRCYALLGISNALVNKDKARYPFSICFTQEWMENKLAEIRDLIGNDDSLILNKSVLETHANFYKYLGDFEKAFYYLEKLMSYKEEYLQKEKTDSVKVLQIEYDLQQKELEFQKLELTQKKELEKINKSLEKKIAERTKDLISKNKELQEYAYIVAHDLKEPIRSIVSFSQLLERKIKGKLNQDELELLDFIKDSGKNMGNLVQALLLYTTVNIDYKNLPENDINQVLQKTLTSINFSIEQNNATINIDWLPKKVKCDEIKISQLFQNIISNAIKFKKINQGITININCKKQIDNYLFSVRDNGIGIEKDYHEKIFKLFKRLNKNQNYEGTGIGLSISKKIVEQHGGEIWLESTFGKGTTFYFTLPRN